MNCQFSSVSPFLYPVMLQITQFGLNASFPLTGTLYLYNSSDKNKLKKGVAFASSIEYKFHKEAMLMRIGKYGVWYGVQCTVCAQ